MATDEDEKKARDIIEYCLKTVKPANNDSVPKLIENCKREIEEIRKKQKDPQLINDPIHGSIKLNSLEQAMINTPEFFRLKDIKQLGGVVHVYPGATHTRFEHSIGVCYIAGEFIRHFKQQLEEMNRKRCTFDDKVMELVWEDENCIRVAALCHDLGHGPFSHIFGSVVENVKNKKEDVEQPESKEKYVFKHEKLSQLIFKKILLDHPIVLANFVDYKMDSDHVQKIEHMIHHDGKFDVKDLDEKTGFKKCYLYEIVANKTSGMDVDKWDYFARDCHYLGLTNDFDWRRCMELSEIVLDGNELHIGFRRKEVNNIYGMFRTRSVLHRKAYQHPVANGIEMMIRDTLIMIKDVKMIHSEDSISWLEAVDRAFSDEADLSGYITLNDSILDRIMHVPLRGIENKVNLRDAQKLVTAIMNRGTNWYKCETEHEEAYPVTDEVQNKDLKKKMEGLNRWSHKSSIDLKLMEIECVPIKFASERKTNPLMDMHFFSKNANKHQSGFHEAKMYREDSEIMGKVSKLNIPQAFIEYRVRLYSKTRENKKEELKRVFDKAKEYFDKRT